MLSILSLLAFATTVATALATLGILPRVVRKSRLDGIILLALVALAGGIAIIAAIAAGQQCQTLWSGLILPLPLLSWLFLGRRRAWNWKAWACIYLACVLQNVLAYLLYLGSAILQSSESSALVLGSIIWIVQAGSVVVAFPFTFDVITVLGRRS